MGGVNIEFDIKNFIEEFRSYLIKKYGKKWNQTYIPFNILEHYSEYYLMISERSDGKTYIIIEMILYLFIKYGFSGVLIRRWETDIKGEQGKKIIKNHIGNNPIVEKRTKGKYHNAVEEISGGQYNSITYASRSYYLSKIEYDENGKEKKTTNPKPFMDAVALSQEEHNKGGGYQDYKIIL